MAVGAKLPIRKQLVDVSWLEQLEGANLGYQLVSVLAHDDEELVQARYEAEGNRMRAVSFV